MLVRILPVRQFAVRKLPNPNDGLSRLHSVDEGAVSWQTSYASWHAYENKKKTAQHTIDYVTRLLPARSLQYWSWVVIWKKRSVSFILAHGRPCAIFGYTHTAVVTPDKLHPTVTCYTGSLNFCTKIVNNILIASARTVCAVFTTSMFATIRTSEAKRYDSKSINTKTKTQNNSDVTIYITAKMCIVWTKTKTTDAMTSVTTIARFTELKQ